MENLLPEGVSVETLLAKYGELRAAAERAAAEYKAKIEPLEEAMTVIERAIHKFLHDAGLQNVSAAGFTAYRDTVDFVSVKDFDAMLTFLLGTGLREAGLGDRADEIARRVLATGLFGLLKRDVAKKAVKDFMAENNDVPPPGVAYGQKEEVKIRKR